MKRTIAVVVFIAALLALCIVPAQAQQAVNPNTIPSHFYHNIAIDKAYVTNTIDTLATGIKLAGMQLLAFTMTAKDSASADVYIDYRINGTTTWTTKLTDSLVTTSNTGTTKEFILRNATTDAIGGIDGTLRIRISWRNVTQGVTSATWTGRFNFKP